MFCIKCDEPATCFRPVKKLSCILSELRFQFHPYQALNISDPPCRCNNPFCEKCKPPPCTGCKNPFCYCQPCDTLLCGECQICSVQDCPEPAENHVIFEPRVITKISDDLKLILDFAVELGFVKITQPHERLDWLDNFKKAIRYVQLCYKHAELGIEWTWGTYYRHEFKCDYCTQNERKHCPTINKCIGEFLYFTQQEPVPDHLSIEPKKPQDLPNNP